MKIREMRESDFPMLRVLWESEGMESDPVLFRKILERNPGTCWVIEEGEELLAAALGLYDGRRGFVQSVVVRPDRRGHGLGSRIVRRTVDSLKALGTDRIRLFVRKENRKVLSFYETLNFAVDETSYYLYDKTGTPV